MIVVGIDPGKNGALAVIDGRDLIRIIPFKGDIGLCRLAPYEVHADHIFLERVTASPQQGVVSAFTFGKYSEAVESASLLNRSCPLVHAVRPSAWQGALGCLTGGDKQITYDFAKSRFPKEYEKKLFNKESADAVCIAWYGVLAVTYGEKK